MIDKAIEKLTKEMMKLNNPFAQAIEEHLTEICTSDAVAEKILQEGKSLKGACDSIRDVAKISYITKRKMKRCAPGVVIASGLTGF